MLHLNTIDPPLFKVLLDFCQFPELSSFSLVGGTALSLQIGHRKSDDLDFFTNGSFDIVDLKDAILKYNPEVVFLKETRRALVLVCHCQILLMTHVNLIFTIGL